MKKYFLYADIYRAKISDRQIRDYFKMAMEDVGIDHMYLDKHHGTNYDHENPSSIEVKQEIFGAEKGRGYLYVFHVEDELSTSQINLIKNSLIMNIMGVVDIKSEDALNEFSYVVRSLKKMIKHNEWNVSSLDTRFPKIKYMDFEVECNPRKVLAEIKTNSRGMPYNIHHQIEIYYKVKKAQLKLQEMLCGKI